MRRPVLITGFEPFGGRTLNASWEAVCRLPEKIGDTGLEKLLLPTVFGEAAAAAAGRAAELSPSLILCVGEAGDRAAVSLEKAALNFRHARIPDNAGYRPLGEPVIPDGPDGLFTPLPVQDLVGALAGEGFPVTLSLSAGSFVCNDLFYSLLWAFRGSDTKVGFVHVPAEPDSAVTRCLERILELLCP